MKGDPRPGQLAATGLGGAASAAQTTVMLLTHCGPNEDCWLCSEEMISHGHNLIIASLYLMQGSIPQGGALPAFLPSFHLGSHSSFCLVGQKCRLHRGPPGLDLGNSDLIGSYLKAIFCFMLLGLVFSHALIISALNAPVRFILHSFHFHKSR